MNKQPITMDEFNKMYEIQVMTVMACEAKLSGSVNLTKKLSYGEILSTVRNLEYGVYDQEQNCVGQFNVHTDRDFLSLLKITFNITDLDLDPKSDMHKIPKFLAVELFNKGEDVYRFYEDGTEGLVESLGEILDNNFSDYDFGHKKQNFGGASK